jgi:ribA/ribD-fused uncharacterized protein
MAAGFPLKVNGISILTSEALYQAFRFPHRPEVQELIIAQSSPMTAKMKSKPYRSDSRPDWDHVRVAVMRWCLRVKLAQHWTKFGALLRETGERPIVEDSHKDDFWGAKAMDEFTLKGANVLGRLLMELRALMKSSEAEQLKQVQSPSISNAMLLGSPILPVGVAVGSTVLPEPTFWPSGESLFDAGSEAKERVLVPDDADPQGVLFDMDQRDQSEVYGINGAHRKAPPRKRGRAKASGATKPRRKKHG